MTYWLLINTVLFFSVVGQPMYNMWTAASQKIAA